MIIIMKRMNNILFSIFSFHFLIFLLLFLLQNISYCHAEGQSVDGQMKIFQQSLLKSLNLYGFSANKKPSLQQYDKKITEMNVKTEELSGKKIVDDLSNDIYKVLQTKIEALYKSVEWAEDLTKNYTWDSDIKLQDVSFVDSKEIDSSKTHLSYHDSFKQDVSFNSSSVHLPVEIFVGSVDILNGLKWSNFLDKVWNENSVNYNNMLWQYFGSEKGFYRVFPALKWPDVTPDLHDVRTRNWYTEGVSSPKDMLILIDTSGSSQGQNLLLIKETAIYILSLLNENDFVAVIRFSETASWVGCFGRFVQANDRNKQVLISAIKNLKAKGMGKFQEGFQFAFEKIIEFNRTDDDLITGARCNRVIMFLTDGGTDMAENVFKKYNPNKEIRVFSYMVGPQPNPSAAIRWIACFNRGYYFRIPAMGDIRSTVQGFIRYMGEAGNSPTVKLINPQWTSSYCSIKGYLDILARPAALSNNITFFWSTKYDHKLGVIVSVTLPVYNKSTEGFANQSILGVMGTDATINELESFIPEKKLGPNGYAFALNNNGYVVFHPDLKAKVGWLPDPPSIDILELQMETEDLVQVRKDMIDRLSSNKIVSGWIHRPDSHYLYNASRSYYYAPIKNTSFSVAVVLPSYRNILFSDDLDNRENLYKSASKYFNNESIWIPDWNWCKDYVSIKDLGKKLNDFDVDNCDTKLLNNLVVDIYATEFLQTEFWSTRKDFSEIISYFWTSESGLTKFYPPSSSNMYSKDDSLWNGTYLQRAMDKESWTFAASNVDSDCIGEECTKIVNVVKPVWTFNEKIKRAVIGMKLNASYLRNSLIDNMEFCATNTSICLLVDNAGFLIGSSVEDDDKNVGKFLGSIPEKRFYMEFMNALLEKVYLTKKIYDFQASCKIERKSTSSVKRSVNMPFFYEMLTFKWWNLTWTTIMTYFTIFTTLFQKSHIASGDSMSAVPQNRSCIKSSTVYYMETSKTEQWFWEIRACNCHIADLFGYEIVDTNLFLLLIRLEKPCDLKCLKENQGILKEESEDPLFMDGKCNNDTRYRRRPEYCFDYNPLENNDKCGAHQNLYNIWFIIIVLILQFRI